MNFLDDLTDPTTLKGAGRHVLSGLGGFLVARGVIPAESAAAIAEHLPSIIVEQPRQQERDDHQAAHRDPEREAVPHVGRDQVGQVDPRGGHHGDGQDPRGKGRQQRARPMKHQQAENDPEGDDQHERHSTTSDQ